MTPYYDDGRGIVLYLGSCLDVLPELPTVDAVITDPPYSEHTHAKQWNAWALTDRGDRRWHTAYHGLGFDALTPDVRAFVATHCARLCPRWTLVFCDLEGIAAWRTDFEAAGLEYVRTLIWDKVDSAPQFTGDRPAQAAEAIVCAHPRGRKAWNGGGRRNVFTHAVNGVRGGKPHPTTKPLPLMRELVALFTNPGDLILDCFAGSGSTLVAAKGLSRRAIGVEIDEGHAETAARRLEATPMPLPQMETASAVQLELGA